MWEAADEILCNSDDYGDLGSVGFAVLFGILDRKLIGIALGGGAGWAVYLLCTANGQSMFCGAFCGKPVYCDLQRDSGPGAESAGDSSAGAYAYTGNSGGEICITLCTIWCRDFLRILEILPTSSDGKPERLLWGLSWLPIFPNLSVIFSCT